jgi:hypothetical protein
VDVGFILGQCYLVHHSLPYGHSLVILHLGGHKVENSVMKVDKISKNRKALDFVCFIL